LRGGLPFPGWFDPVARYGARASFSLYAVHYPFLAFVLAAIGYNARRQPDLASFALIVGLCLLAVGTAWLFSRATEAKTGRLREAIRRRRRGRAWS